jgi:hypothetical protein
MLSTLINCLISITEEENIVGNKNENANIGCVGYWADTDRYLCNGILEQFNQQNCHLPSGSKVELNFGTHSSVAVSTLIVRKSSFTIFSTQCLGFVVR